MLELVAGDIVMLNSGGPPMMVLHVFGHNWRAFCEWSDGPTSKRRGTFPVACLRKPDDPQPPVHVLDDTSWREELGIWTPPPVATLGDDEWPDEIG